MMPGIMNYSHRQPAPELPAQSGLAIIVLVQGRHPCLSLACVGHTAASGQGHGSPTARCGQSGHGSRQGSAGVNRGCRRYCRPGRTVRGRFADPHVADERRTDWTCQR